MSTLAKSLLLCMILGAGVPPFLTPPWRNLSAVSLPENEAINRQVFNYSVLWLYHVLGEQALCYGHPNKGQYICASPLSQTGRVIKVKLG